MAAKIRTTARPRSMLDTPLRREHPQRRASYLTTGVIGPAPAELRRRLVEAREIPRNQVNRCDVDTAPIPKRALLALPCRWPKHDCAGRGGTGTCGVMR